MSSNPVLLITGGNTGLGFESVKALCASSKAYTILLGGRSLEKASDAAQKLQQEIPQSPSVIKTVQIDVEDDDSITKLFDHITEAYGRLDILINNAGAAFDLKFPTSNQTMREMWNKTWDVNTTGAQIVTHIFVPLLLKSSDPRLIFITSGTSPLVENGNGLIAVNQVPPKGWPKQGISMSAYRSCKTGLNMVMREWNRILKEDGVKVWAISPGLLATGLGGFPEMSKKYGGEDPALGGHFVKDVVEGTRDQDVGLVVSRKGIQPW